MTGSLAVLDSLRKAAEGIDLVYINLPATHSPTAPFVAERDGMHQLLRAVPRHVPILKLSEIGASHNPDFVDITLKYESENLLAEAGNPFVIFRPTWFMESFPYILTKFGAITYFGQHAHPVYWLAGQDYARMVVTAAEKLSQVQNRVFTMQGPEQLTFREAAQCYIQAYDPTLKLLRLPLWLAAVPARFSGEWLFNHQVMSYYDKRQEVFESQAAWDLLGAPKITVEEFVKSLLLIPL
nr:hypothetical protein [Hymenobacter terrenus]